MKKIISLFMVLLVLLAAGCTAPVSAPGAGVSVYEYWLAAEFPADKNGNDAKTMIIYDAYYLAPQEWLLFAPTITEDGYQCQLFRLTGNDLQWVCRWPEEGDFTFDEWGFASAYLPDLDVCAMYNPYRQQFYLYDVTAETGKQIQLPLAQNLDLDEREFEAVCLTDNLFVLGRRLPEGRVGLSLYDLAAESEQPLAEMNGRRIQNYWQLEPGVWLMMTNDGDIFELHLSESGARIENLHSCPQEWSASADWENYNAMRIVPNTAGVRVLLSVFGEEDMIYQVIDWQAGAEIGRYSVPQYVTDATGQLMVNDTGILGAQGDIVYFPQYFWENNNYYLNLLAYDYITGEQAAVFDIHSQNKLRLNWFQQGFCSPDGQQLLLCSYRDIWSLPLDDIAT